MSMAARRQVSASIPTSIRFALSLDVAIPCGLMLNELVSNALIHAFPDKGDELGQIRVDFHAQPEDQFTMVVSDNGAGLPQDFSLEDVSSLGLQL